MNEKQQKAVRFIRKVTGVGLLLGLLVFLSSFFVSDFNHKYILSIGLSIMVSSIITFGFGMFIHLMEEVSDGLKEEN